MRLVGRQSNQVRELRTRAAHFETTSRFASFELQRGAGVRHQHEPAPVRTGCSAGRGPTSRPTRAVRLAGGLTLDDIARHASVSPRTLTRKFRAATGLPPGEWLQRERLRRPQRLLESTDTPVQQVARGAGYDSSATMRAQFALHLHTSPRAYRKTFRS